MHEKLHNKIHTLARQIRRMSGVHNQLQYRANDNTGLQNPKGKAIAIWMVSFRNKEKDYKVF